MFKKILIAVGVTTIVIGSAVVVADTNTEVQLQQLDARTKQNEVNTLNELNETYEVELEKAEGDKKRLLELREQQRKLEEENQRLQSELQAKRDREAQDRRNVVYAAEAPRQVATTGNCASWIAAAGISDVGNAQELINRESGCNPNAVNPSSGACNVAQELPCGKSGCSVGDGACSVKWMNSYVLGRYGSWANAVDFHNANNWY